MVSNGGRACDLLEAELFSFMEIATKVYTLFRDRLQQRIIRGLKRLTAEIVQ